MTLALLPIGFISIFQTQQVIGEAEKLRRAALLFETTAAASAERELIHRHIGAAVGLSATRGVIDPERCDQLMRNMVALNPEVIFAVYVPTGEDFDCASGRNVPGLLDPARVQAALSDDGVGVEVIRIGDNAKSSPVIVINRPIEQDGDVVGLISIGVPIRIAVRSDIGDELQVADLSLATLTLSGEILSAPGTGDGRAQFLPETLAPDSLSGRAGETFIARGRDGLNRMYAVVNVIPDKVNAVGSWSVNSQALGLSATQRRVALIFPVLMWIAGIAVAYFGLQRLVIRHIRKLRSAMRRFALGERDADGVRLDSPPEEFRELERAFNRMSLILTEAEAKQQSDLADKEVLLREVHHRVKNNLQLIASIMNMQLRSAKSDESRKLLTDVQRRVNGLAILHRTLYVKPDMTSVDARDLILAVVSDIARAAPEDHVKLDSQLEGVTLFPDQAVPLSMFLTEVLSNAFKFAGTTDGSKPSIDVTLRELPDGKIELTVTNTKGSPEDRASEQTAASGLGIRLMNAFVRQLDGEQSIDEDETRRSVILRFRREHFEA